MSIGITLVRAGISRALAVVALTLACGASVSAQSLGKDPAYFYDRYGSQEKSKSVIGHPLTLPFQPMSMKVEQPSILRRYAKDGVTVTVLFDDPSLKSNYVMLTLTHNWTDEQLAAALAAYGSGWRRVAPTDLSGTALQLVLGHKVYRSSEGHYAWFPTIARQLHFYSADLITRFQEFAAKQKAEREKVPVF